MVDLPIRPRRNRRTASIRELMRETVLQPSDFVLPLFVEAGREKATPIPSLPGCSRFSPDRLAREAAAAYRSGIRAVALFPALEDRLKDARATASADPQGLLPETVRLLKKETPDLVVITDVAMDPYSSDGHDGLVQNGEILNDETLPILAAMALAQAQAGADIVAPSDMMDGRVGFIRKHLDARGFTQVGICSYAAKYASAFYGPFRDALQSAPKAGDKKTYQMDPGNAREALREVELDVREGADIVMVKPAHAYLDIIRLVRERVNVPVAAYHVSGEYAMLHAAAKSGGLDADAALLEVTTAIKRAGADIIFTYGAMRLVELLSKA